MCKTGKRQTTLKWIKTASKSLLLDLKHKLSSEYGLVNCNTLENKATILQNLYELDELIFDEYELRLSSIEADTNDNEYANLKLNYDSLKTKLIEIFG